MRIIVKCFAGCRDVVGAPSVSVEFPAGTTVGEAFAGLIESYPALAGYDRSVMLAVNREYADRQAVLEDGDELACIPPVSGGTDTDSACERCRGLLAVAQSVIGGPVRP